jgi:hypothetical protein
MVVGIATCLMLAARLSLAVHGLALMTATALWVVFLVDGSRGWAWSAVGLGVLSLIALGVGAYAMIDDSGAHARNQDVEERLAGLAGLQAPLMLTLIAVSVGAAGTTPV